VRGHNTLERLATLPLISGHGLQCQRWGHTQ
jgi:hypothetical protein